MNTTIKNLVKKALLIFGLEIRRAGSQDIFEDLSFEDMNPLSKKERLGIASFIGAYSKAFFDAVTTNPGVFFGKDFARQLLMVDSIRYFVALFRYIYFVKFLGNLKTYDSRTGENLRADIGGNQGTVEYNLTGLHDLSVARSLRLIKPLSVIETYRNLSCTRENGGLIYDLNRLCDAQLLAIGPRTEGEILCLLAHGFRISNIRGLDLISYSPWIDLGDMHAMPYENSSWDIVLVSMVLTYSEFPPKVVDEVIRVIKDGGLVGVSLDNNPDSRANTTAKYGYSLACAEDIVNLFGSWVDRVYFSHDLPEPLREKEIYTASVIFSVSKSTF